MDTDTTVNPIWRADIGTLSCFNFELEPEEIRISDIPLRHQELPGAFVSAQEIFNDAGGRHMRGAIYDSSGALLPELMERDARYERSFTSRTNPLQIDRERMAAAQRLAGEHVYLGMLHGHFGHFLVESLARAWFLIDHPQAQVIFHHRTGASRSIRPYWQTAFQALGLDMGRITFAARDLVVDRLVLPSAQYEVRGQLSPGYSVVYWHIRDAIARSFPKRDFPRRVYLTRRQFNKFELRPGRNQPEAKVLATNIRMALNEEEAERYFEKRGYTVVAPETLPFDEQIIMMAQATHVAGIAGAALHMILFNSNPNLQVITLAIRAAGNQRRIETLKGVRGIHIQCVKYRDDKKRPFIDMDVVDRALAEI